MGTIIHRFTIEHNVGGRHAGTIKDGPFIRAILFWPSNLIRIHDMEGNVLHEEAALVGEDFQVLTVSDETSSFGTPHVVLCAAGFTPGTDDTRVEIIATTYVVAPPEF